MTENSRGPRPAAFFTTGVMRALIVAALSCTAVSAFGADSERPSVAAAAEARATATFAGGCFWCMEAPFDALDGVLETMSGYTGGTVDAPTYEQVSAGGTGHAEAVRVTYDPSRVTYEKLLEVFWRNVDPLTPNAQFCDSGDQYRSAIFYAGEEQRRLAEASKQALESSGRFDAKIVTEIAPAAHFHPAEDYHQDYYRKNPLRYRFYRYGCGRDARLEELWGEEAGGKAPSEKPH